MFSQWKSDCLSESLQTFKLKQWSVSFYIIVHLKEKQKLFFCLSKIIKCHEAAMIFRENSHLTLHWGVFEKMIKKRKTIQITNYSLK